MIPHLPPTGQSTKPLLDARGLRHRYGDLQALGGVDLALHPGTITGLLGPNGAGKTSLLRILCGLLKPMGGQVHQRGPIGWCPQELAVWPDLTCQEQLLFLGSAWRLPRGQRRARAAELLRAVDLEGRAHTLAAHLSGGMKRRLSIALALVHDPGVLILDEPEVGLDPTSRGALRQLLRRLAGQGRAVLLSTHNLFEVQEVAHQVILLDKGRVLDRGTPQGLVRRHLGQQARATVELPALDTDTLQDLQGRWPHSRLEGRHLHLRLSQQTTGLSRLLRDLQELQVEPIGLEVRAPGLEEVYHHLSGQRWRP
jgi:ABC-2 type transport system ATP-binding protein